MSATDRLAGAPAVRTAASSASTFRELSGEGPPLRRIDSSGHERAGLGRGTYIADELADRELAEAHPRAVFAGAGDHYFRLAGDERGFITPEQLGCPLYAPGVNQQPFIQAAIEYAEAVGLNGVLFSQPRYELWAPVRPAGLRFADRAGCQIAISRSMALVGTGAARVVLDCRNSEGGRNDTVTQFPAISDWPEHTEPKSGWIGHCVYVDRNAPSVEHLRIENIELEGTVTYNPEDRSNANYSGCGLYAGDNVKAVHLRDVTIRNCAGVLYSFGGRAGAKKQLLENCIFDGSPQAALRCGLGVKGTFANVQAGNAHRIQIFGGHGHLFAGCRFYGAEQAMVLGGAGGGPSGCQEGFHDTYPLRSTAPAPTCVFQDLLVENVGSLQIGSYARGWLRTVDTVVEIRNFGKLEDVDLQVEAWADGKAGFDAVSIAGPADPATQVPGAPPGTSYDVPRNIRVRIACHRTAEAMAAGNAIRAALGFGGGLLENDTIAFTIAGTAGTAYRLDGPSASGGENSEGGPGFAWPRIDVDERFVPLDPEAEFNIVRPGGAFAFTLYPGVVNGVAPLSAGVHEMSLVHSCRFADGQLARIHHRGSEAEGEQIVRLPQADAGAQLPQDRLLLRKGDYIDLRWNDRSGRWDEAGYWTGARLNLSGSLKLETTIEVAPSATVAIEIGTPGATNADSVTSIHWNGAPVGGLQITALVAAEDVVAVHLFNPTAQTATIPKGTIVEASIRRRFGAKPVPVITLGELSLGNTSATAGEAWTATISGAHAGSTIAATSSDGAELSISGHEISGTFAAAGGKTLALVETLEGAANSPRTSTVSVEVAKAPPVLNALTLSNLNATASTAWSATIEGRTEGSTIAANSPDNIPFSVSGNEVSGTFPNAGRKSISLVETLAGAANSPRTSTATIEVAPAPAEVEPETTALVKAMGKAPSSLRTAHINRLVARLKAATDEGATSSIWSKLDVFFMFAAADEQAALLDWKDPANRAATRVGSPVFTPNKGVAGLNTATDYLELNYNPGANSGAASLGIAREDGHASIYALTEGASTTGALTDNRRLNLRARAGSRALIKLNSSGNTLLADDAAPPCSVTAVRSSAGEQLAYRNGSLSATGAVASAGIPGAITLLKSTDQQVASVSIGKALTSSQVAEYHAARLEYIEALENIGEPAEDPLERPEPTPPPPQEQKPLPSLPEATVIPPTLVGPWEPTLTMSGSTIVNLTPKPEDHVLLTSGQLTTQPADRRIKVQDGAVVRAEGIDMGGYELSIRGREHVGFIGVFSDNEGKPESDGSATGCPGSDRPENPLAARPQVLYQYCRFVNFKGTDKDHFTSKGVDNVTGLAKVENLPNGRFRLKLAAPFPEGLPTGRINPVRKVIVAGTRHEPTGTNLPLQGNNWNYELDQAIDPLTYEGTIQALGKERWSGDARLVPQPGDTSTGGRVWLCKTGAGQHSDSMFQVEDERPVGHLMVENSVTSGNYQVPGIIGSPGSPFKFRNLHAFKIFADPQDPTTQNIFVKGTERGHFEGCYFEMPFERPLAFYSVYPRTGQAFSDAEMPQRNLTWTAGGQFTGQVVDCPPPRDFAPEHLVGRNWKGGNYPGKRTPTAADLTDITLKLDALSSAMTAGQRVGVINVVHSTEGEVIELEVAGDVRNIAGVNAKPGTNLIRRGLVVGPARLASGATYTVTIKATLRSNPGISLQKTFVINVP